MKMFEILWELPEYDNRDTNWANAVEKNGANRLAWGKIAQFVQSAVSVKLNKTKICLQ